MEVLGILPDGGNHVRNVKGDDAALAVSGSGKEI